MPGTIIFKPVQAKLLQDNDFFTKMDTYCVFTLGNQEIKTSECKAGGEQPHWSDTIIIKRAYEPYGVLNIFSKEWSKRDAVVGTLKIDLQEIESKGRVSRWYKIFYDNQPAGELFMESMFIPDSSGTFKQTPYQQSYAQPPSAYKDFGFGTYPANIYSPAKQEVQRTAVSQTPGFEYTHQVTYPHISHYLTPEEINKLHSRQEDRYYPKRKVVADQPAPPSWEGYESVAIQRSPEKQEHSVESTAGGTPEKTQGTIEGVQKEEPEVMTYYPMLGGISYVPSKCGVNYEPFYGEEERTAVKQKEKSIRERFDDVANEKGGSLLDQVQSLETTAI